MYRKLKEMFLFVVLVVMLGITQSYAYTMTDITNGISAITNASVDITLNYRVDSSAATCVQGQEGGAANCTSLLMLGFGSNNFGCVKVTSIANQASTVNWVLPAPATAGTYDIWVASRTGPDVGECSSVSYSTITAAEKSIVGASKLTVTVPPPPPPPAHVRTWSWGYIDTLSVNGSSPTREIRNYTATAGSNVTLNFPYDGDPARQGCPGCLWEIVVGITGGTKYCIGGSGGYYGYRSGTANITLTAPSAPGTYDIWAQDKWSYGCDQAYPNTNSGTAMGTLTVAPPTPKGSYGCSCSSCRYTSGSNFSCSCRRANGSMNTSTVDASAYNYYLSNNNGNLTRDDGNHCSGYVY